MVNLASVLSREHPPQNSGTGDMSDFEQAHRNLEAASAHYAQVMKQSNDQAEHDRAHKALKDAMDASSKAFAARRAQKGQ